MAAPVLILIPAVVGIITTAAFDNAPQVFDAPIPTQKTSGHDCAKSFEDAQRPQNKAFCDAWFKAHDRHRFHWF